MILSAFGRFTITQTCVFPVQNALTNFKEDFSENLVFQHILFGICTFSSAGLGGTTSGYQRKEIRQLKACVYLQKDSNGGFFSRLSGFHLHKYFKKVLYFKGVDPVKRKLSILKKEKRELERSIFLLREKVYVYPLELTRV